MKKAWFLLKKYWYFLAIPIGFVSYLMIFRKDPRNPPPELVGSKPPEEPPEEVVATNFVERLIEKKKVNDEEIDKLNRKQSLDRVNRKY